MKIQDGIAHLQKFDPRQLLDKDSQRLKSKPIKVTEKSWIAGAGKQGAMYMKPTRYSNLSACVDNSAEKREALFEEALAHRRAATAAADG